jgi:Rieske Fe-S protein
MHEMNRREFVIATTIAATACAVCTCSEVDAAPTSAPTGPIDAGELTSFSDDKITDKFAPKPNSFFIIRSGDRLYAPSATCTHKKCNLKLRDNMMACTCHGSKFSNAGEPTKGPAKIPLLRYGISVNDAGHVIVDKSKQFEPKDWEAAGSFVMIKK